MCATPEKTTVQSILQNHYAQFEHDHPLPEYVRDAAHALMSCRTAVLGGHVQACPDGHVERHWYNSCHHRACPQCAFLQTENWLERQRARLLATDHYHIVFTLPHELNNLWKLNWVVMANLLFRTVRSVLLEFFTDPKHLGAQPGILMALHTWGQTLILHPHLHCLCTGGGLDGERWKAAKNGYLFPAKAVMMVFRKRIIRTVRRALDKGELTLPEGDPPRKWHDTLDRINRKKWNVRIRERYDHGEGVAHYLARYMKGGPIGNSRLIADDGGSIRFRYKNNHDKDEKGRGKTGIMELAPERFIGRLLRHIPPPGLQTVRSYGLYAGACRERLEQARALLGQGTIEFPEKLDWQDYYERREDNDNEPHSCPVCGKTLVCTRVITPRKKEKEKKKHRRWTGKLKANAPPLLPPELAA